jgi:hypothetical protein
MKKKQISIILQIILGGTFIFSAYSKIIAPGMFEILMINSGFIETRVVASYLTRLLIGFELALGILLLQPNYLKKIVIPATLALLTGFTLYLGYVGFIQGNNDNCGCFGELIEMTPIESIFKNIVFIILSVFLYKTIEKKKKQKILPIVLTLVSFALVFLIIPIKSSSDFKFAEYTSFEDYGEVNLAEGEYLLAVFNLDCDHCQETATEIWEMKDQYWDIPEMFVLFYQEGDLTVDYFNEVTYSQFPYSLIDENTFFDLIGNSPPRIYWLQNGEVAEFWDEDIIQNVEMNFVH